MSRFRNGDTESGACGAGEGPFPCKEAMFWSAAGDGDVGVQCGLCPHMCRIAMGAAGLCGVRENRGGRLAASGYGVVSSIALDPIEKKPLYLFHPGKAILSIGGFGCNLKCRFCQNHEISVDYSDSVAVYRDFGSASRKEPRPAKGRGARAPDGGRGRQMSPDDVAKLALQTVPDGNIGVAYTYNEPLIGFEFLYDCAKLVREAGLHNVLVTNGYICPEPLDALLPFVDAMNIDLKGFSEGFYRKVGGDVETVRRTIEMASRHCHVEVTTLVIPGENEGDVEGIAAWLSSISPDIPLHLSRFFPRHQYSGRAPTPRETILALKGVAGGHLKNVFAGNMG